MREIYEIEFDPTSFAKNIEKAENAVHSLDSSLKETATSATKVSFTKPISELSKLKELLSKGGADSKALDGLFSNFEKGIPEIQKYLAELKKYMATVKNPTELKALKTTIDQVEAAIGEFTKGTKENTVAQKSFKAQILENKRALEIMTASGKEGSKEYKVLFDRQADLIDQSKDLQGALKKASSDTYKVDLGVEGIQLGIGAYQTYLGVLGLVGGENEELQKTMQKLLAVQQVAQGVQQIAAFITNKEGLALELKTLWTRLSTTATAEATVAQRAFNTALLASGIGALVVGLGLLVANWDSVSRAIGGTTKEQERLNEAYKAASGELENAKIKVTQVGIAFEAAKEGTISKKRALDIYNDTLGETLGKADSLEQAEKLYVEKTEAYLKATLLRATAQELFKEAAKKSAESILQNELDLFDKLLTVTSVYGIASQNSEGNLLRRRKAEKKKEAEDINKQAAELLKESYGLESKYKIDLDGKKEKESKKAAKKQIENVYEERKRELLNQIAKEHSIELKGTEKLTAEMQLKYAERSQKIFQDLKDKKITVEERDKLLQLAGILTGDEYKKAIDDFEKLQAEKQKELQENLTKLRLENLDEGTKKEFQILDNEYRLKNEALDKLLSDNLESEAVINQMRTENEIKYQNDKIKINQNALNKILEDLKSFESLNLSELEKNTSSEILAVTDKYNKGLINKRVYEKELARIEKEYQAKKKSERLAEIEKEITAQNEILKAANPNDKNKIESEINKLIDERNKILTEANKKVSFEDNLIHKIFGLDPNKPNFNEDKQKILGGLKSMVNSAIDILKEQTRAEIEAYDLAIKLQQDRVNQAQKIADNGNAEYLQMEEERLKELEAKKEAAARRQLEIDAALQASQILVAIAGAAAQIAQGGVPNVIAGIAAIAAAAASGFALLNQLSSSRPKFFDGDVDVRMGVDNLPLGRNRRGRDTIPAMLNEGERVVPTAINKKLKGIRNEDLPKLLDNWNKSYHLNADFGAKDTGIGEIKNEIASLKKGQKEMTKAVKNLSISFNVDENGVAAMVKGQSERTLKSDRA